MGANYLGWNNVYILHEEVGGQNNDSYMHLMRNASLRLQICERTAAANGVLNTVKIARKKGGGVVVLAVNRGSSRVQIVDTEGQENARC